MKILHTSDWHIGRSLYGRKRYNEFAAFLDWLAEFITNEKVEVVLIAGDIFDTSLPSNRSQELYYKFLCKISGSCCRHVVVIAGNHDSPSFLEAPKELLRALNIHVVGSITENPEEEVIILRGSSNIPEAIVCAVPYLRDRDIRIAEAGESIDEKSVRLIEGLKKHYADLSKIAKNRQKESGDIPIIGMGHLFTTGGKTVDGDGVRELYVGSLAHIGRDVFPASIDYLALGHLHVPQKVGNAEHIRYSGSPIPMGYGEAKQEKKVVLVEFSGRHPKISEHTIPCFQPLERISGGIDEIIKRITELKFQASNAWLEVEYTGYEITCNLRELIDNAISGSDLEIRRIKNRAVFERVINRMSDDETLNDLDVNDVFIRCLDIYKIPEQERGSLIQSYKETITSLDEEDSNAQ